MNRFALLLALALSPLAPAAGAQATQATFERINRVALQAFPPGTRTYELYLVTPGDRARTVHDLAARIGAAKRQRARWVVAGDDAELLEGVLREALALTRRSLRVQTELVLVSPIASNPALAEAAREVGVALEFRVLPPPPAEGD